MKQAIIKNIGIKKADAVILNAPYEKTVSGTTGTAKGPEAICEMLKYQVETWDCLLKKDVSQKVDIAEKSLNVSRLAPEKMIEKVRKETQKVLEMRKFPIILGGEHLVSAGSIGAAKQFFKDLTVVQIDAHADLRNDNSDYEDDPKKVTKFAHSCVMRRTYDMGCKLVQIGIRSMSPMEYNFIRKNNLEKNIFYAPVKENYKKIISKCPTKKVYLTIDIDGFDPAVMPSTGTPEPGGISWDWGMEFFRELFSKKEVVGLDIVEVSQGKWDSRTEFTVAKMLYHLIGLKF